MRCKWGCTVDFNLIPVFEVNGIIPHVWGRSSAELEISMDQEKYGVCGK